MNSLAPSCEVFCVVAEEPSEEESSSSGECHTVGRGTAIETLLAGVGLTPLLNGEFQKSLGYVLLKMNWIQWYTKEKCRVRCPSHLAGCLSVANAISSRQRGNCTEGEYTLILSPDKHFFDKCFEL